MAGSNQLADRRFREAMGRFCTGIAIVTSYDQLGPVGLTCQSVTSVSLDPPLVLFCGGRESKSLPRILRTNRFCINILGDVHHGTALGFAVSGGDKFANGEWQLSPSGLPHLEGALAHIECVVETTYLAGDHYIVVGAVETVAAAADALPLLFYRSTFHLVGNALERPSSAAS
jgi:3-hydroxy-9,10-secoandrosta-1,3,5(10)-triene-9,17-dione monooxygenase reductase component